MRPSYQDLTKPERDTSHRLFAPGSLGDWADYFYVLLSTERGMHSGSDEMTPSSKGLCDLLGGHDQSLGMLKAIDQSVGSKSQMSSALMLL